MWVAFRPRRPGGRLGGQMRRQAPGMSRLVHGSAPAVKSNLWIASPGESASRQRSGGAARRAGHPKSQGRTPGFLAGLCVASGGTGTRPLGYRAVRLVDANNRWAISRLGPARCCRHAGAGGVHRPEGRVMEGGAPFTRLGRGGRRNLVDDGGPDRRPWVTTAAATTRPGVPCVHETSVTMSGAGPGTEHRRRLPSPLQVDGPVDTTRGRDPVGFDMGPTPAIRGAGSDEVPRGSGTESGLRNGLTVRDRSRGR